MHVRFVQNSEELPQSYFVSNITEFTEKGIEIRLNFSSPLFVSQGEVADQVSVKLLKEFFMKPQTDHERSYGRSLAFSTSYDDSEYVVFTEDLPLLVANEQEFEKLSNQVETT